jgi:hypothetical protein
MRDFGKLNLTRFQIVTIHVKNGASKAFATSVQYGEDLPDLGSVANATCLLTTM